MATFSLPFPFPRASLGSSLPLSFPFGGAKGFQPLLDNTLPSHFFPFPLHNNDFVYTPLGRSYSGRGRRTFLIFLLWLPCFFFLANTAGQNFPVCLCHLFLFCTLPPVEVWSLFSLVLFWFGSRVPPRSSYIAFLTPLRKEIASHPFF